MSCVLASQNCICIYSKRQVEFILTGQMERESEGWSAEIYLMEKYISWADPSQSILPSKVICSKRLDTSQRKILLLQVPEPQGGIS